MRLAPVLLIALALSAAVEAAPVEAPADTSVFDPVAAPSWTVRGTERPLETERSFGGSFWRGAAHVPATAANLIFRPVIGLIQFDERTQTSKKVMRFFSRGVQRVNTMVAVYLGYETGFGMTILGLKIHSSDWYGSGLDNRFRFSYLNTRDNLIEDKLAGDLPGGFSFRYRARFRRSNSRTFYGYGADSSDDGPAYDDQLSLHELRLSRGLFGPLESSLSLYRRGTKLMSPKDADEIAEHPAPDPAVWDRAVRTAYTGVEGELRIDTRDRGELSSRGTLLRVAAGWNNALTGDDGDYRHLTAEAQVMQTLFLDRVLALRVFYEGVDPDDPAGLSFMELRGLGGRTTLRGFARDRFVDRHLLAATAEYRYRVTTRVQGRLFSDWGTVAPSFDGLRDAEMHWSGGLGIAFEQGAEAFVIHYARSREGGHFYAGTTTPFGQRSRRRR